MANVYVNHDVNAALLLLRTLCLIADIDVRILIESFDDLSAFCLV